MAIIDMDYAMGGIKEWVSIGEITSTTTTSSTSIDMSLIPSTAKEALVEMGWLYNSTHTAVQTHVIPKNSSIQATFWNYGASNGMAFFIFNLSDGFIKQFIPYGSITEVYAKVYYR